VTGEVLDAEKDSLPIHVEMCGQRYASFDGRLKRIERLLIGALLTGAGIFLTQMVEVVFSAKGGG